MDELCELFAKLRISDNKRDQKVVVIVEETRCDNVHNCLHKRGMERRYRKKSKRLDDQTFRGGVEKAKGNKVFSFLGANIQKEAESHVEAEAYCKENHCMLTILPFNEEIYRLARDYAKEKIPRHGRERWFVSRARRVLMIAYQHRLSCAQYHTR